MALLFDYDGIEPSSKRVIDVNEHSPLPNCALNESRGQVSRVTHACPPETCMASCVMYAWPPVSCMARVTCNHALPWNHGIMESRASLGGVDQRHVLREILVVLDGMW